MAKRTTEELAQQLADMKWGNSLSDLEIGANEARALGRAFVALRQQLEAVKPEQDDGWIPWGGGKRPVADHVKVEYQLRAGAKGSEPAKRLEWQHEGTRHDIIAYRVVS